MSRVSVEPVLLHWARARLGSAASALSERFPRLHAWESGEERPTLRQLQQFAKAARVPLGYLFLNQPPEEDIPIPDFRTAAGDSPQRPSPDLLETIYTMQQRQSWLREILSEDDAAPLELVGSARLSDRPDAVGREMRRIVGLGEGWASSVRSWREAVGELRRAIEAIGVMAVINSVVGNNTHRKLDVSEFRGFALSDSLAPLIFVNGADAKSAQMFTLAHELAHIWLGREGVSGFEGLFPNGSEVEEFCNKAAAEFLVPASELKAMWNHAKRTEQPFETVARHFKVSPIVAGRRAMDERLVDRDTFFDFYHEYIEREQHKATGSGGGDFYSNQNSRVGEFFAAQVVKAALEGRIGFKEAYDLTGLRGGSFQEYAGRLGFEI